MKIRLENISKYYDRKILDDISFQIDGIHSLGIIGESGCGKSTIMRLLAGMEYADKGKITMNDLEVIPQNSKRYQSEIGYVFQKHNLFPHLSIKKNILLILLKVKKIEKDEAKQIVEGILKKLHLEGEMDKKPSRISGGQAQRASIARALSTNPSLIFLDEPTAALDPILTREVLEAVNELKSLGKDFIFVTHEITFLKGFADYVIFMDHGKIIEHGTPDCLLNPKTKQLKRFMCSEVKKDIDIKS